MGSSGTSGLHIGDLPRQASSGRLFFVLSFGVFPQGRFSQIYRNIPFLDLLSDTHAFVAGSLFLVLSWKIPTHWVCAGRHLIPCHTNSKGRYHEEFLLLTTALWSPLRGTAIFTVSPQVEVFRVQPRVGMQGFECLHLLNACLWLLLHRLLRLFSTSAVGRRGWRGVLLAVLRRSSLQLLHLGSVQEVGASASTGPGSAWVQAPLQGTVMAT